MQLKIIRAICLLAVMLTTAVGFAQEGHPLVGVWLGNWGPSPTHRNDVTLVLSWDGKNITGLINPGPDSLPLKAVALDSTKWTVHLEADAKDRQGNPVHFVVDGKLENIGSYNRTLTGTWNHGTVKGDFRLRRD